MELSAKTRDIKENIKSIRSSGFIPAVIYSKKSSIGEKPVTNISIDRTNFDKVYQESGETSLVTLKLDDKSNFEVLIHDIQREPISLEIIHVGFFEVDLTQTIDTPVPVEIINEDSHELVKSGEALIIKLLDEIEVRCLPNNIPSHFEVDATKLNEIGDVLNISESIQYDKDKVEILTDPEEVLVKLDYAEQLEEEEEEPTDVGDVEVITEKQDEDSEEEASDTSKDENPTEEKSE